MNTEHIKTRRFSEYLGRVAYEVVPTIGAPFAGRLFTVAVIASAFGLQPVHAQEGPIAIAAEELQFGPIDPANPDAGEMAILAGDPTQEGPVVLRARAKAGSFFESHSHSQPEYVTLLSGRARIAFGEAPDEASAEELGPGSFFYLPAGEYHTLWVDEDIVADLFTIGPVEQRTPEGN